MKNIFYIIIFRLINTILNNFKIYLKIINNNNLFIIYIITNIKDNNK